MKILKEFEKRRQLLVYLNMWRIFPTYYLLCHSKFKREVKEDIEWWRQVNFSNPNATYSEIVVFGMSLLSNESACVNIILNRLHRNPFEYALVRILFKPLPSLYLKIAPENIEGGFYCKHGFSTIINAHKIGKHCVVHQQVTIGVKDNKSPIIGDNVTIYAGAIILGGIHIGNGAIIGAGSVVIRDVPDNTMVAGNPASVKKHLCSNYNL